MKRFCYGKINEKKLRIQLLSVISHPLYVADSTYTEADFADL